MIDSLMNLMFRCGHRRRSLPVTPPSKPGGPHADTYVVCLDCGKHFAYDIKEMRLGRAIPPQPVTGLLRTILPEDSESRPALFGLFGGRHRGN